MRWRLSNRADPDALPLADRHYNRQKPGTPQFVPTGACLVMLSGNPAKAVWVTSWPLAEYTKHAWAGAWVNTLFRNEGAGLSSELITEAVAATLAHWDAPPLGIVSFVNADKVRHKRDPGRCYRKAGWRHVGFTQGGLHVFQQLPAEMPSPSPAHAGLLFA